MNVTYTDPEPNGLATMIGGLIQANLEQHPERAALLAKPATFGITAPDAEVSITIRLSAGGVEVANGIHGKPDVSVRAGSETLVGLSAVPLRFGMPDAMTKEGRAVTAKLFTGELKVKGLILRSSKLAKLNKLLSVV
jgi:hypothetical protein